MDFFIYRRHKMNSLRELSIESSFPVKHKVVIPYIGGSLNVLLGDDIVAKVNGTNIELLGEKVKIQKDGVIKWGWLINSKTGAILYPKNNSYLLNDEVVARVTRYGGIIPWFFLLLKTMSFTPYSPFIKLEYDSSKLDPLIAACIHLVDVSHSFQSS
jgi:hypothetical protein